MTRPNYQPAARIYRGVSRRLKPGACPSCHQVVSVNRSSGKRRSHKDHGLLCPGSGEQVIDRIYDYDIDKVLAALPPTGSARPAHRSSSSSEKKPKPPRAGQESCPECGRNMTLNQDGTLRSHRPEADTFTGPYCPAGRPKGRQ